MRNFRNLKIWQQSVDVSVNIYKLTNTFPAMEKYGISSQIQRASVSIASNIAEGASRASEADFARFLEIAMGSSFELQTQLTIAHKIGYLEENQLDLLVNKVQSIEKQINVLIMKLRKK